MVRTPWNQGDDEKELDLIIALRFPEGELGNSLNDRLQRASFQHG
ncbi:MAG: hypothetical protein NTZ41_11355 [Sphingobacteriales bacterium]|jgi:hypothetical protein|nr:hypothetical protein [Sphingobacteriales bacterium]